MIQKVKKTVSLLVFGTIASLNFDNSILFSSFKIEDAIVIKDSPASWLYSIDDKMYFETHDPRRSVNQTFIFSKDGSFNVDRHLWWHYGVNKKFDKKFVPERFGGRVLAMIFKKLYILPPKYTYKGPEPIIEAYGHPTRWTFATIKEFKGVMDHLQKNFDFFKNPDITQKSILMLEIGNKSYTLKDVEENTVLSNEEKTFLKKYFLIPEDLTYLKKFFGESLDTSRETTSRVGSNSESKYKTIGEEIFHNTLKLCKDFNTKKIAPWAIGSAAGFIVGAYIFMTKSEFRELVKKYLLPSMQQQQLQSDNSELRELVKQQQLQSDNLDCTPPPVNPGAFPLYPRILTK